MNMISDFINLLTDSSGGITVLITVLSVICAAFWALFQYRQQVKDKRFSTYHDLIDQLVNEQRNPDRTIKLDRQIAVIYELRNYPKYFPVSIRILKGLKEDWKSTSGRLLDEINLTLEYMSTNCIQRFFKKHFSNK